MRPGAFRAAAHAGLVACLGGCAAEPGTVAGGAAERVVSLDLCADQFVVELVDRDRIAALSPDATKDFSLVRERARGIRQVRPTAEEALALGPDRIVRSYGGGPNAARFLERAGIPVVQIGFAGDLAGVREVIRGAAEGLGAPERGAALLAAMDARLARVAASNASAPGWPSGLFLVPGGVSAGRGTLPDDLLRAAGIANFETRSGYPPIPLERLARRWPDLYAVAFLGSAAAHEGSWSAFRHRIVRERLRTGRVVLLDGAWMACAGWGTVKALEALHRAARQVPDEPGRSPPSSPPSSPP